MALRPRPVTGRRRRLILCEMKSGEAATQHARRKQEEYTEAGAREAETGQTECAVAALSAKPCVNARIRPLETARPGKSRPKPNFPGKCADKNHPARTTGRHSPKRQQSNSPVAFVSSVRPAEQDHCTARPENPLQIARLAALYPGSIAVTSISIRIAGSIRPATTIVDAGGLAPKLAASCGQHASKSSRLGA